MYWDGEVCDYGLTLTGLQLLVFSGMQFKIDHNKNQNRSIDIKSRIWQNKEGKYAKTLAKIQVTTIFLK